MFTKTKPTVIADHGCKIEPLKTTHRIQAVCAETKEWSSILKESTSLPRGTRRKKQWPVYACCIKVGGALGPHARGPVPRPAPKASEGHRSTSVGPTTRDPYSWVHREDVKSRHFRHENFKKKQSKCFRRRRAVGSIAPKAQSNPTTRWCRKHLETFVSKVAGRSVISMGSTLYTHPSQPESSHTYTGYDGLSNDGHDTNHNPRHFILHVPPLGAFQFHPYETYTILVTWLLV